MGLEKSSDNSFTTTFVESIGLPPPRLIRESALVFSASLIARFIPLIGACCLIPEKTPTSFRRDAFSTVSTSLVFSAMVCPVIMNGRCDLILSSSSDNLAIEPGPKWTLSIGRYEYSPLTTCMLDKSVSFGFGGVESVYFLRGVCQLKG